MAEGLSVIQRRIISPHQQSRLTPPLVHGVPIRAPVSPGFTIIEIFVAILITMISLSVALQMFITAAYLRGESGQLGSIQNWIQEDFESVKAKAESFEQDVLPYSSYCGAVLSSNLAATFITDSTAGLGGASVGLGTKNFSGKSLTLTRTADYASSADPTSLVSLNYSLAPASGGTAELEVDAEVAIYAAFKCPN